MKTITTWIPGMIYRTDYGFDCYSIFGEVPTSGNATCVHGAVPDLECSCGFTSLAKRAGAEEEPGMHVMEVTHPRELIWTDAEVVRSLAIDMVKIHLSPECYECGATSYACTATELMGSGPGRRVEIACQKHASDEGLFDASEVSDYLGVEISWDAPGRMHAFMALGEAEEVMMEAEKEIQIESVLRMLSDDDLRAQWAARVEREGPLALLMTITMLQVLPYGAVVENAQGIIELFANADPGLISAIDEQNFDIGDNFNFVMALIRR